ncbi:hypothetical protein PG993_005653 [Apiospora rasikravindrae]|uniref:AB hydrolase-1 domain-containing protein n=1 Tax=Apiospora rasikravindrae TaxID=990691 RepID=A0ABR1TG80_9PEZI
MTDSINTRSSSRCSSPRKAPKDDTSSLVSKTSSSGGEGSSGSSTAGGSARGASVARAMARGGSWTTTMNTNESSGDRDLFFVSLNPLAPVTVVLLHIIFSSHLDWVHIWPKLSEYHLIIPDLPQHSRSRHVKPFSFDLSADLVADLIRKHAHDGKAHLVGMSTGGYIALEMVRRHPDVIQSVFASGVSYLFGGWQTLSKRYPKVMALGLSAMLNTPSGMLLKATGWATHLQNEELLREIRKNTTPNLSAAGVGDTHRYSREDVIEAGKQSKRVAVVAGGKQDHIEGPGEETRTFVVKNGIHVWNLQLPELFAQSVRAWIEGYPMPVGLEELE